MRKTSHFQKKEPLLERFLQLLRFHVIFPFINKDTKVLDLGCGYKGTLLNILSPNISEGIGVDVSVTKSKIAKNVKLIDQKGVKLPKDYFDLITCLAVVEHLEKPEKLLTTAYKSLNKNGKMIITTPSPIAKPILEFMAFKLGVISKQEIKDHKKYYNKKKLLELLMSCGFKRKNIEIKNFSFGLNTLVICSKH